MNDVEQQHLVMAPPANAGGRATRRRLRPGWRSQLRDRPNLEGNVSRQAVAGAPPAAEPAPVPPAAVPAPRPRPRTMLTCHAPHPGVAKGKRQYSLRPNHGREIMPVPFFVVPTGRVLEDFDQVDTDAGCLGVRCPSTDCKAVTEYRVVAHAGCVGSDSCAVCLAIAAGHVQAVPVNAAA